MTPTGVFFHLCYTCFITVSSTVYHVHWVYEYHDGFSSDPEQLSETFHSRSEAEQFANELSTNTRGDCEDDDGYYAYWTRSDVYLLPETIGW